MHGGYGYTRDFPVEQYWRDNRLNMIHEGTHVKQAGSVVDAARLRFDFTHFAPLEPAQIAEIERLASRQALKSVDTHDPPPPGRGRVEFPRH